ncbi:hypothetical protein ACN2CC_07520 [Mesorhizobium muleiense]
MFVLAPTRQKHIFHLHGFMVLEDARIMLGTVLSDVLTAYG